MAIPSKGPAQHDREILPNRQPKSDGPAIDNNDVARQQEYIVSQEERQNLSRGLSQRHVQMIAIAGAIVCESIPQYPEPSIKRRV